MLEHLVVSRGNMSQNACQTLAEGTLSRSPIVSTFLKGLPPSKRFNPMTRLSNGPRAIHTESRGAVQRLHAFLSGIGTRFLSSNSTGQPRASFWSAVPGKGAEKKSFWKNNSLLHLRSDPKCSIKRDKKNC